MHISKDYEYAVKRAHKEALVVVGVLAALVCVWAVLGFGVSAISVTVWGMPLWALTGTVGMWLVTLAVCSVLVRHYFKPIALDIPLYDDEPEIQSTHNQRTTCDHHSCTEPALEDSVGKTASISTGQLGGTEYGSAYAHAHTHSHTYTHTQSHISKAFNSHCNDSIIQQAGGNTQSPSQANSHTAAHEHNAQPLSNKCTTQSEVRHGVQ